MLHAKGIITEQAHASNLAIEEFNKQQADKQKINSDEP